jgi:hypothetical protein
MSLADRLEKDMAPRNSIVQTSSEFGIKVNSPTTPLIPSEAFKQVIDFNRELNIEKEKDRISGFINQLHKRILTLEARDK